jgi:elongator complex protein 3
VYGASVELGRRAGGRAQHAGLGARLLARAARIARGEGFAGLAVISAVGTRAYYRARGFRDGALYQTLALASPTTSDTSIT